MKVGIRVTKVGGRKYKISLNLKNEKLLCKYLSVSFNKLWW